MEIASLALWSISGFLLVLAALFKGNGHRDMAVWSTCAGIVAGTIGGFGSYQNRFWKEDAEKAGTESEGPNVADTHVTDTNVNGGVSAPLAEPVAIDPHPVYWETGPAPEHAWLLIAHPRFRREAGKDAEWIVTVKNVGKSAAIIEEAKSGIFDMSHAVHAQTYNDPPIFLGNFEEMEVMGPPLVSEIVLEPGKTLDLSMTKVYYDRTNQFDVSRLGDIEGRVFLRTKVEYWDEVGKPHKSAVVFLYDDDTKQFKPYRSYITMN